MNEAELGELAGRIAAESSDAIAKATKNGMFVPPVTTKGPKPFNDGLGRTVKTLSARRRRLWRSLTTREN